MRATSPISRSILMTASFAPPWLGPQSDATPAATHANGFASDEPAKRTMLVLAFCSWSACSRKSASIARTYGAGGAYSGSIGVLNIILRKFAAYVRSPRGYTNGCPIECL